MDWVIVGKFILIFVSIIGYGIYSTRRDRAKRSRLPLSARWGDRLRLWAAGLLLVCVMMSGIFLVEYRFHWDASRYSGAGILLRVLLFGAALLITVLFNRSAQKKRRRNLPESEDLK